MDFPELQGAVQSAILECFATNAGAEGRADYYGIHVSNLGVSPSSIQFDLTLTFRKGERYCCFEDGCHHGLFGRKRWNVLRQVLERQGKTDLPPLSVSKFHGRVEQGAIASYGGMLTRGLEVVKEGYEYATGPYLESEADEGS